MATDSERVAHAIGHLAKAMVLMPTREGRASIRQSVRRLIDFLDAEDAEPVTKAAEAEPAPAPKNCHSCANLDMDGYCVVTTGNVEPWQRNYKPTGQMPKVDAPSCPCFKARS